MIHPRRYVAVTLLAFMNNLHVQVVNGKIDKTVNVTIDNTLPKTDINGMLMDVHDGNIKQWQPGGLFYWYGMGYQNCTETTGILPPRNCPGIYQPFGGCGFRIDHAVNVYSSPDLKRWSHVGDALPMSARPTGIYFRPNILFNDATKKFVLWINFLPEAPTPLEAYVNATYIVATSSTPTGPFVVQTMRAAMGYHGGGDFTLFKDTHTDIAYIAYDAWSNNHRISIERLTKDYLNSEGLTSNTSGLLSTSGNEAPIFFRRGSWYYLMWGPTCCFCEQGSGSNVWASSHPLGPWKSMNTDINPMVKEVRTIKAQESFVIEVPSSLTTKEFVYVGDRWTSAPDKLKSHDLQFWQTLEFDDAATPPRISVLAWRNTATISVFSP
eukprot:m.134381 g.134381  ORF g.134381 m.134381 type:complete len:381 (-) comp29737_c0_seq2:528-1670(-)